MSLLSLLRSILRYLLSFFIAVSRADYNDGFEKERLLGTTEDEEEHDFSRTWPNDLGFDVIREEQVPVILQVTGRIPPYAAGILYRNGPGASQVRNAAGEVTYSCSHWFDGFAQLHKFELLPGANGIESIRYSSRFTVDSLMEDLAKTGKFDGYTFAQKRDPCLSLYRKVMCLFTPVPTSTPGNHNVGVTITASEVGFPRSSIPEGHKARKTGYLVARTDEPHLKALDPETLEPIGIADQSGLHPLLRGPMAATHAQTDDEGNVFNFNLDLGATAVYRVFKTSAATGETDILATISAPNIAPAYMHSFFMSEDHVILCVWGAHLKAGGIQVLWEKNVLDAISPFNGNKPTRWFVVDRKHGRGVLASFESPAAFCFHTINCFSAPSQTGRPGEIDLICDLIEYANLDIIHKFYYENMRSTSPLSAKFAREKQDGFNQHLARYRLSSIPTATTLPLLTKFQLERKSPLPKSYKRAIKILTIPNPIAGDMPVLNPHYAMKPYRYLWNCTFDSSRSTLVDGLCKIDVKTGKGVRWENPVGHTPGEAIFIADPDGKGEDEGVVLTVVLDGFEGTSYLLCLDAKTMQEVGMAGCEGAVPFTFHGQFVGAG